MGGRMADTAGAVAEPGFEARLARLEADVAHWRGDIAEIKATLNRLALLIDGLRGLTARMEPAEPWTEPKSDTAENFSY
jgi:hypothetical protein